MATAAEIQSTYDAPGTEFYRLWLDRRMAYSCALWGPGDTLETAQEAKLGFLHDLAHVTPGHRVLDIGCGWGASLEYGARVRGVRRSTGITLSPAQRQEVERREIPGVDAIVVDYRDFAPEEPFDAVISMGMLEHIATPEQARRGQHLEVFRDYFGRVHRWARPGAWFALQTILMGRLPRRREDIEDMAIATRRVFPGSKCGRLEDLVRAAGAAWEVMEVFTRRDDYVRTAAAWVERLEANEVRIREGWGEELYRDYLHCMVSTVRAFECGYAYPAQIALRRTDARLAPGRNH
jgi:cyclopropane-fatty-acyl-phospholipid synthase